MLRVSAAASSPACAGARCRKPATADRSPSSAKAEKRGRFDCRCRSGSNYKNCAGPGSRRDPVFPSRKKGLPLSESAIWRIVKKAKKPPRVPEGNQKCLRTGSVMRTPPMPSTAAPPSIWSRPPSATHRSRSQAATCTPGRRRAPAGFWRSEDLAVMSNVITIRNLS